MVSGSTTDHEGLAHRLLPEHAMGSTARANVGGAPIRDVRWQEWEDKLAERLAAKEKNSGTIASTRASPSTSNDVVAAPDSGIRPTTEPIGELTYSVYTVAELEARRARPRRASMVVARCPQSVRWTDVWASSLAVARAAAAYLRAPKPRPHIIDSCRIPLTVFVTDLKAMLGGLPWKNVGLRVGIGLAAAVVFLFAVLAVAELTDDVKRTRPVSMVKVSEPTPQVQAPEPVVIEIDDVTLPAKVPSPARKPAAKTTKIEVFNP